jgi:hypothetical protein
MSLYSKTVLTSIWWTLTLWRLAKIANSVRIDVYLATGAKVSS